MYTILSHQLQKLKNFRFPDKIGALRLLQIHKLFSFSFKSHHFPTYLLCVITCNNISRPVHDTSRPSCDSPRPPSRKSGVMTPNTPRIDAYEGNDLLHVSYWIEPTLSSFLLSSYHQENPWIFAIRFGLTI